MSDRNTATPHGEVTAYAKTMGALRKALLREGFSTEAAEAIAISVANGQAANTSTKETP